MRRHNERVVLSALDRHPGLFNAELARRTGLAAQTISVILRALDEQGLIARGEVLRGRRGQPATPLHLRADGAYSIGAAMCFSRQLVGLSDFNGTIIDSEMITQSYPDFDNSIETIAGAVGKFMAAMPDAKRERIAGLGLALPLAMDRYLETLEAPQAVVQSWGERDFSEELSRAVGLDVWTISYGTAASGAEARQPDSGNTGGFAYFFLGNLLMGGIVDAAGPLAPGNKGELLGGMLVPGPERTSVRAGMTASTYGLTTALVEAGVTVPIEIGADWDWHPYASIVEDWIDRSAKALAHVVVNTGCTFELNTVVFDGVLPQDLMGILVDRVGIELKGLPVVLGRLPQLRLGHLGPNAAMIGAARLPLQQRFFNTDPYA